MKIMKIVDIIKREMKMNNKNSKNGSNIVTAIEEQKVNDQLEK